MADGEQYPRCGTALVVHRSFSTRVRFGFGPKELAALKGTWKLITHVEGGQVVEYDNPQLYTFADDKLTVKRGDELIAEGRLTSTPRRLRNTWTFGGPRGRPS